MYNYANECPCMKCDKIGDTCFARFDASLCNVFRNWTQKVRKDLADDRMKELDHEAEDRYDDFRYVKNTFLPNFKLVEDFLRWSLQRFYAGREDLITVSELYEADLGHMLADSHYLEALTQGRTYIEKMEYEKKDPPTTGGPRFA